MLRIVSTYAVPAARRGATGLTRIDATTRPMASAPAKLARVRARVVRNPAPKAPRLWMRTLNLLGRGAHRGRGRHRGRNRRGRCDRPRGVTVHGWWRRGGDPGRADGLVEGGRPGPVLVAGLQPVVDEAAEGVVALLDPDAIGLGREGVADDLEEVIVVLHDTSQ